LVVSLIFTKRTVGVVALRSVPPPLPRPSAAHEDLPVLPLPLSTALKAAGAASLGAALGALLPMGELVRRRPGGV